MSATLLDGKALAARVRTELTGEAARLAEAGVRPGLAAFARVDLADFVFLLAISPP